MNRTFFLAGAPRWLVCLLLAVVVLTALPGLLLAAPIADHPVLAADAAAPLFAGLLQDVVGNRTRLIQVSFVFILIGIFILWKK